jgi:hypothetical protein
VDEADWQRLVKQVRLGDCLPFLGAGACSGTLPTAADLSMHYAEQYEYPFHDRTDLARVTQYALTEIRDSVDLKAELCDFLHEFGHPPPHDLAEPHALLADLPISVFLTTNYDGFLATALRRTGKRPQVAVSPWWDTLNPQPDPRWDPTPDAPLVYHLHGSCAEPRSMVVTESDYLTYMVNIVEVPAATGRSLLPTAVLDAMSRRPMLFLGYSLQDWTFRVLFHGLARATPRHNQRRHVSVQLMPKVSVSAEDAERKARRYLEQYLDGWNISIYLETASEFCAELRERLEGAR